MIWRMCATNDEGVRKGEFQWYLQQLNQQPLQLMVTLIDRLGVDDMVIVVLLYC